MPMPSDMSIWDMKTNRPNEDERQAQRMVWFNKIKPKSHWKNPIDCWIDNADYSHCSMAAVWFTGAPLEIVAHKRDKIRVTAPGYYLAVGA